jgi:hypothetical protein
MKTKSIITLIGASAISLCFTACDSKEEKARKSALEQKADNLEDQADATRSQGKDAAKAVENEGKQVKKEIKQETEKQADQLEKDAKSVRDQK